MIVGQEARAYDELKAAEVLLQVQEEQVASARDDVAAKRQAAADHLVLMQQLEAEEQAAKETQAAETRAPARTPRAAKKSAQPRSRT